MVRLQEHAGEEMIAWEAPDDTPSEKPETAGSTREMPPLSSGSSCLQVSLVMDMKTILCRLNYEKDRLGLRAARKKAGRAGCTR